MVELCHKFVHCLEIGFPDVFDHIYIHNLGLEDVKVYFFSTGTVVVDDIYLVIRMVVLE